MPCLADGWTVGNEVRVFAKRLTTCICSSALDEAERKRKLRVMLLVCIRCEGGRARVSGIIGFSDQYWCYDETVIEFVV